MGKFVELASQLLEQCKALEAAAGEETIKKWNDYPELPISLETEQIKSGIESTLHDFHLAIKQPIGAVTFLGMNVVQTFVFQAIYRFNIASKLSMAGETSFVDLAEACGIPELDLTRLLRYAMTWGIFAEPRSGFVAHTGSSRAIAMDHLLQQTLGMCAEEMWPSAVSHVDALVKWPGSKEPNHCGAALYRNTTRSFFEDLTQDPERNRRFADGMSFMGTLPGLGFDAIITGYNWDSLGQATVVDLGGSYGVLAGKIAAQHQDLHFVVQDLPEVIDEARKQPHLPAHVSFMVHNFFDPQTLAADVYMFRWIFHDWPDKYCQQLLQNLIPVLRVGARILIMDMCLPEPGQAPKFVEEAMRTFDLTMWCLNNAKERSHREWTSMVHAAHPQFKLQRMITEPGALLKVIEIVWIETKKNEGNAAS